VKGEILTPPLSSSILSGITRDTVLRLAHEIGYAVRETVIPRELLYVADECFFTGTAVEVTPVVSVDRIPVGTGEVGPVTKAIQQAFFGIVKGDLPDRHGWLTQVGRPVGSPRT
jgi:branched-chain amino acid aminotransferase